MRITYMYRCGHIRGADVDARMARNSRDVREARAFDGFVRSGSVCHGCTDHAVREWIANASKEQLVQLAQHVSSVKAARDWILSREPVR